MQVYHYLGGLRHVYWDHAQYGKQAAKNTPLELPAVEMSSKILIGASAAATAALAVMSF